MRILIIGGGGREHALAWAIAKSPQLDKLFIAPGNAGTAGVGTNVPVGVEDFEEINTNQRALTELDAAMLGNMFARIQYQGYNIDYHQTIRKEICSLEKFATIGIISPSH